MKRSFAILVFTAAVLIVLDVSQAAAQSSGVVDQTIFSKNFAKSIGDPRLGRTEPDAEPTPTPTPSAPTTWTGPYAGIYLGGNIAKAVAHTTTEFTPSGYFNIVNPPVINSAGRMSIKPSGVDVGGQVGYNYQVSHHVVVGAEADFGWTGGAKKSDSVTASYAFPPANSFAISQSVGTDWSLTARGRAGYIWHSILIYGTGGLAMTNLNYEATFIDDFAAANESGSIKTTRLGWTGGIGGEYKFSPKWSIKVEGLYADLGRATTTSTNLRTSLGSTNPFTHSVYLKEEFIRFGLNYHF
jgi:outer membrane immunogenic protein